MDFKKPLEPFGYHPAIASLFYLATPELCAKKLDTLAIVIEWMGVPDNLSTYYASYKTGDKATVSDNSAFKAKLKLHDNRAIVDITDVPLFHADGDNKTGASKANTIGIDLTKDVGQRDLAERLANYQPDLQLITGEEVLAWSRYWQLELEPPDF